MRDYNFFSPYIEAKGGTSGKKHIYFIVLAAFIILFALSYYAYNLYKLQVIKKELTQIEKFLLSEATQSNLQKYKEVEQKVQVLNTYQNIIEAAASRIESSDKIKTALLESISKVMPKNVFLKAGNITRDVAQLECISSDRTAIAEFVYNLKNDNVFDTVYIGYINEEGEGNTSYIFTLICKLEVVSNDEAK
jgi:Tfp pilus assembly protein PilN